MHHRIHITGAAGTGTTTLGKLIAQRLDVPHLDADDFYWSPSDTPFTVKRPPDERVALIQKAQGPAGWVLSGSVTSWGTKAVETVDLIVFLTLSTPERLRRLRKREARLFGPRIGPGGDMEHVTSAFLDWAAQYDAPDFHGRSRLKHDLWLAELGRPVLRLTSDQPPEALAGAVTDHLGVTS